MKCKNCGENAPEEVIFCPNCGSRDFDCAEMTPVTQKNPSPGKELLVSLFERFSKLGFRLQTVIALALAIVFFFLGFAFLLCYNLLFEKADSVVLCSKVGFETVMF